MLIAVAGGANDFSGSQLVLTFRLFLDLPVIPRMGDSREVLAWPLPRLVRCILRE
jgi:hypothetical protein